MSEQLAQLEKKGGGTKITTMEVVATETLPKNQTITSLNLDVSDGGVYALGWAAQGSAPPEVNYPLTVFIADNNVIHNEATTFPVTISNGKINAGVISSSTTIIVKLFKYQ